MSDTPLICVGEKLYRIAQTRGGDPSVYHATSFTVSGPPVTLGPSPAAISYTQNGNYILAVLEEVDQ